ncbi:hypothetical protein Taro_018919 [Colocasia esculenta]|uniref:Uncharacterized protein n=1 Tax=Colocasia esculenta TaxID=4460 RepID=A0A843UJT6_COLES|nr:hypothetical protein [Colocasia esculenta]
MLDAALSDFKTVKAAIFDFSRKFLNGQEIAVKRLSKGSKQGYQEFHNEVRLIARLPIKMKGY